MTLHLYDSRTRTTEAFAPLVPGRVGLYVCGPTTQGAPHLGHLRTFLAFDVLHRWLARSGYRVRMIRNVTDIDDKILTKAAEHDEDWNDWSYTHEVQFGDALDALGSLRPSYEPRATGHVTDMIALIDRLIERGHAYADSAGSVYFDVASYPDYGSLTRQTPEQLREGAEDPAPGKRDPRDFALWKAAKDDEPATASWDTPWGRGRPGWHLECSAMSRRYLGEEFDIHGGGLDLRFPHHENEQAQSRAAGFGFARRWMHSGMLAVDGQKMGKSLDNFVTAEDALSAHPAPVVRLALVHAHYRATVEWNATILAEMTTVWERLSAFVARAADVLAGTDPDGPALGQQPTAAADLPAGFVAAMDDDLNVAEALAVVHGTVSEVNPLLDAAEPDAVAVRRGALAVRAMLDVLGLDPLDPHWASGSTGAVAADRALDALVTGLLEERAEARAARDWARADSIRDALAGAGVIVEDGARGARWSLRGER